MDIPHIATGYVTSGMDRHITMEILKQTYSLRWVS